MFDQTYMRIRQQELLDQADHARLVRSLARGNGAAQAAAQQVASVTGDNGFWGRALRSTARQLPALVGSRAGAKPAQRPVALRAR